MTYAVADFTISVLPGEKTKNDLGESLKPMEMQMVALIGRGMSNKEIAAKLSLSEGTVRNSISVILSKLSLRDRKQVAIWAVQTGVANMEYGDEV